MKIEVKQVEQLKREITIQESGESVKNVFEEVFKKLGQTAKVKGFRAGHVPREVLEREFSSQANEAALKELIPLLYEKALDQEKIKPVDLPQISEVKLERTSVSFKATVEVVPEVKLPKYEGLKLSFAPVSVGEDDVDRYIDSLKERRKADAVDEVFAKSLGYPTVAALRKAVKSQLEVQKDNQQRQDLEQQVVDKLQEGLDLKVPQSLVNKQLEEMMKNATMDLMLRGISREELAPRQKELAQKLEPQARSQVKIYLVLSEVAKKENIAQDDQMTRLVMELIFRKADWQPR